MISFLYVGIGGACGSLVRYILGKIITEKTTSAFPLSTLLINVSGALLLGLLTGVRPSHTATLLLADGFLGAYTTFSTFMYEGFTLFHDRKRLNTAVYIGGTVLSGLLFYWAGWRLADLL